MDSPPSWTSADGLVNRTLLESSSEDSSHDATADAGRCDIAPSSVCRVKICVEQIPKGIDLSDTKISQWLASASKNLTNESEELKDGVSEHDECTVDVRIGEADTEIDRLLEVCLQSLVAGDRCRARLCLLTGRLPGAWAEPRLELRCTIAVLSASGGQHAETLAPAQLLTQADAHRLHGNRLFTAGRTVDAFFQYRRALSLLLYIPPMEDGELSERVAAARTACRSNVSACQLQRARWEAARDAAGRVLQHCPDHVRCLYRRGAAHLQLQDLELAGGDLQRVLHLQPGHRDAARQLDALRRKQKQLDLHTASYMTKFLGLQ